MAERRRALSAEERLARLRRERSRLRRERLQREVGGNRFRRLLRVIPLLFERQGTLLVRRLRGERAAVIDALRDDAVFALDTALRLSRGHGFLAGGDLHAYVTHAGVLDRLQRLDLIEAAPCADTVLVRPWAGRPRLFAAVVRSLPPSVQLPSGHRVVEAERLRRELVGAVGARPDLFALAE